MASLLLPGAVRMHFHLPKPLHGWRAFVGEVGIFVVVVLIALGAEQVVEDWHWHQQVRQSDGAFKAELTLAAGYSYERLAIKGCLQTRLAQIATRLNQAGSQWRAMPETFHGADAYYSTVLPVVYRAPNRQLVTDAWRNALADGTINHIEAERARTLSSAYTAADEFMRLEREEGDIESRLGPLGLDRPTDVRTQTEMLQTIALLDRLNDRMLSTSRELLDDISHSGLRFTRREAQDIRSEIVKQQRDYRGACVEAPPLKLGQH
jgi:hypothetical protein